MYLGLFTHYAVVFHVFYVLCTPTDSAVERQFQLDNYTLLYTLRTRKSLSYNSTVTDVAPGAALWRSALSKRPVCVARVDPFSGLIKIVLGSGS